MCILVVDDSLDAREIMQAALETAGLTDLAFAASGKEALGFLGVEPYAEPRDPVDVILLDVVMPRIDGVEACARLRGDERYTDIPVIMVTGERDIETLVQAFVAGANDYVNKPFNQVELVARVRGALRLKGELDRRKAREDELLQVYTGGGRQPGRPMHNGDGGERGGAVDPKTGRLVPAVMDEALAVWAIRGKPAIAVIAVQIDDFASIRQPDIVTAIVEMALCSLRTRIDTLFVPFGNGLFVIALPELARDEADALVYMIRRHVGLARFPRGTGSVTVTVAAALPFAGVRDDPRLSLISAMEAIGRGAGDQILFV